MGTQELDKRRIAITALSIFALVVVSINASLFPLMRQALADREAQRVAAKYAKGLTPCVYSSSDLDAWLRTYLPGPPSVSIYVMPSFFSPSAVRLVGRDLYVFELNFPLYDADGTPPARFNPRGVPTVYHSRVSSEIARLLPLVLSDDISHAQAERGEGADGTLYYFQTSPKSCAMTWSPLPGTRAGDFVELFNQLVRQAKTRDATEMAASEKSLLAILRSLQSN